MDIELRAPQGKTRVVGFALSDVDEYLIGDFDTQEEAFRVTDTFNAQRESAWEDAYFVYDDTGMFIRGSEEIVQELFL